MSNSVLGQKVDFIGVGVQKAATSWIFQCLLEHPEIRAGVNKETNFFNFRYSFGYPWYQSKFEFGEWKTGEFSTLYFIDKNVPERIYRYNPHVKLTLSVRDPVQRAFSHHQHEIRRNRLPKELYDFKLALQFNPTYVEQGKYATYLRHFLEYFSSDQIHIIVYEDIAKCPLEVISGLYEFLGVNRSFRPESLDTKVNIARTYKSRNLDSFYRSAKNFVKTNLGSRGVELAKKTGAHRLYKKYNETVQDSVLVPPLSRETHEQLLNEFSSEIAELQALIARDLSHWLKPT